ncbi:MAG TPA: hypothetical protein VMS43_16710 [Allosphingosinicella sp.]|nr:hypothetical protein [Allosphingosinicella sp.]
MKHFALLALALTLTTSAVAQPAQDSDRTVTADQAAYGEVRINDIASCPRGQPSFSSTYNFPIRFQTPFQNDRYAVILGQSGALVQPGQSLSYTTEVSDRAREGMTISVNLRCNAGSRVLTISYAAIGKR